MHIEWASQRVRCVALRRRLASCAASLVLMSNLPGALAADGAPLRAAGSPPRIGLALSGGGARGIAHVGVLKALEEMRIPISCVTGTSMGAVVGGSFAVGRAPAELEKLVLEANWDELFRDQPPRTEIAFRRKMDDFKTLFAPEFGVKDGGLAVAKGAIAGVSIEAFFRGLAEPAILTNDFHKLPIPFEAMTTDIETGDSVVLSQGSVAQAMRASMSVPGAIAPVELDGRLLVDGGIANNLPIDQARKLCGDVIVAVNIATTPLKRKELTSAFSVAAQLINFLGKNTVDQQLKSMTSRDVLIEPDLGDISAASFDRSKDAIRIGEQATRKLADSLQRYSLPPEQYAALRARQVVGRVEAGAVSEIRFQGLDRTNPEVLRGLVQTTPGEPLDEAKIGADLRRIYGRGDFESVDYHISSQGGPRALLITPREKSWGPDYLRFGLGLESDFEGESAFNLLVQYRRTWLNKLGGEWLTEGQIGQDTHLQTEFYQPLNEAGIWFTSLYGKVGQVTRPLYDGDQKVATYRVGSAGAGIDFGAVLGTWGMLRTGLRWTKVDSSVETGSPVLPTVKEVTSGVRVLFDVDQLDHAWFPQEGAALHASYYVAAKSLGSEQSYQRLDIQGGVVKTWGRNTLSLFASGGTDFDTDMPAYESFTLGGPLRLSGFRIGQFSGREYGFARAMYYNRVVALPDILGSGAYVGASAEIGRISERAYGLSSPGTLLSGSVFLGASTAAGPAYLGVGIGTGRAASLYLLLGAP